MRARAVCALACGRHVGDGSYDAEDGGEQSEDAYNSDDEPGLGDELYPPACTAEEADDEGGGGGGMVLSNER